MCYLTITFKKKCEKKQDVDDDNNRNEKVRKMLKYETRRK